MKDRKKSERSEGQMDQGRGRELEKELVNLRGMKGKERESGGNERGERGRKEGREREKDIGGKGKRTRGK